MRLMKVPFGVLITFLSLAGIGTWLVAPTRAQRARRAIGRRTTSISRNGRYSPLDQINTSNASS